MRVLECWGVEVRFSTIERVLKTRIFCDQKILKKEEEGRSAGGAVAAAGRAQDPARRRDHAPGP